MLVQGQNETRLEYLIKVAISFAQQNSHHQIDYDEATCDGFCLADDLQILLQEMQDTQVEE